MHRAHPGLLIFPKLAVCKIKALLRPHIGGVGRQCAGALVKVPVAVAHSTIQVIFLVKVRVLRADHFILQLVFLGIANGLAGCRCNDGHILHFEHGHIAVVLRGGKAQGILAHLRQAHRQTESGLAPGKGVIAQGFDAADHRYLCERTACKSHTAHLLQRVGYHQRSQPTGIKGIVANAHQRLRKINGSQRRAGTKGVVPNAGDVLIQLHRGQFAAIAEGTVVDFRYIYTGSYLLQGRVFKGAGGNVQPLGNIKSLDLRVSKHIGGQGLHTAQTPNFLQCTVCKCAFAQRFYRSGQIQDLNTGILKCLFADFRNAGKIELRQRLTTVKSRGGQRFQVFRQPHLRQRRTALKYALTQLGYAIGQRDFLQLCTVIKSSVLNGGQCIRQVHLRQRAIRKHYRCQFGDSFFYMDNFNIAAAKHLFTHML